jgi:AAHS family 4-hydroxybenzoate transporter-like MFS transporter
MNVAVPQDLDSIIDDGRISGFQITIIALCGLIAMLDGFDTQAIAFVAPEIITAWGIAPGAFGPVFAAGLFGGLIGALVFGAAGDRVGRKPALFCSILLLSIASLVTPLVHSLGPLIGLRFIAGIGLGGALPGFISLSSEYAPQRLRGTLVAIMFCGFPLGAVFGGAASAWLIPAFGWKSVLLAGGVLPLAVLPFFMALVPESVRFLAVKGDHRAIVRILHRMKPEILWNGIVAPTETHSNSPISSLFTEGRALGTILLWITFFLSLLLTYFLINWIPIVARRSGMGIEKAVLAVSILNLGAVVGCVVLGRLTDRFGPSVVIGVSYVFGAVAIACMGYAESSSALLYLTAFFAGAFSIGAQICTVALCATFYETFLRATGVGWAMGIGRTGAIAGPVFGGMLLSAGVRPAILFAVAGATSFAAALAVLAMGYLVLRERHGSAAEPASARRGGTRATAP